MAQSQELHDYEVTYTDKTKKSLTTDQHHNNFAKLQDWIKHHKLESTAIGLGIGKIVEEVRHIKTWRKPL